MKKRAFSLLELSVVLLVIGLITAGIMKGISVVRTGRISAARSLTVNSKINEIPGMVSWYETTMNESFDKDETVDNSQTTNWYDISPESIAERRNALTAVASDNVVYRATGINSLPSIQFTGSGTLTLSSFFQGSSNRFTIFVVFQPTITVSGTYMTLLDAYSGASTNYAIAINSSNLKITDTSAHTITKAFLQSTSYIICSYNNEADSKAFVSETTSATGSYTGGATKLNGLTVGADENVGNAFTGLISEIIIFNRSISDSQRKSVMSYLGQKYNIKVTGAY
ncbi:MAG TPA: prepilin-type N-terminal cleavage/methylation domain-containing protein [Rickettsiales bacterium]|nr:prepilin-type N-terminal cleavage/methylation domain-containing protein [Rickettsiales bacterium]